MAGERFSQVLCVLTMLLQSRIHTLNLTYITRMSCTIDDEGLKCTFPESYDTVDIFYHPLDAEQRSVGICLRQTKTYTCSVEKGFGALMKNVSQLLVTLPDTVKETESFFCQVGYDPLMVCQWNRKGSGPSAITNRTPPTSEYAGIQNDITRMSCTIDDEGLKCTFPESYETVDIFYHPLDAEQRSVGTCFRLTYRYICSVDKGFGALLKNVSQLLVTLPDTVKETESFFCRVGYDPKITCQWNRKGPPQFVNTTVTVLRVPQSDVITLRVKSHTTLINGCLLTSMSSHDNTTMNATCTVSGRVPKFLLNLHLGQKNNSIHGNWSLTIRNEKGSATVTLSITGRPDDSESTPPPVTSTPVTSRPTATEVDPGCSHADVTLTCPAVWNNQHVETLTCEVRASSVDSAACPGVSGQVHFRFTSSRGSQVPVCILPSYLDGACDGVFNTHGCRCKEKTTNGTYILEYRVTADVTKHEGGSWACEPVCLDFKYSPVTKTTVTVGSCTNVQFNASAVTTTTQTRTEKVTTTVTSTTTTRTANGTTIITTETTMTTTNTTTMVLP